MNHFKPSDDRLKSLPAKHRLFVVEYIKDHMPRRAAIASGHEADEGLPLLRDPKIMEVIDSVFDWRAENFQIDADWVLMQAADNSQIAKQAGNIPASNQALTLVAKHATVDAFAAEKVIIEGAEATIERLRRGRRRLQDRRGQKGSEISFM